MTLQEKILYCRKKEGLSQEALAEKIGVSRQAISKWETGEATPEISKLVMLAKTFDVTTDWLLSDEDPAEEKKEDNNFQNQDNTYSSSVISEDVYAGCKGIFGFFKKLVIKFSWIVGVYMIIIGLIVCAIGGGSMIMTNAMFGGYKELSSNMIAGYNDASSNMFEEFANSSLTDEIYGENEYSDEDMEELLEIMPELKSEIGIDDSHNGDILNGHNSFLEAFNSMGNSQNKMVDTILAVTNGFSIVIVLVGIALIVGGIIIVVKYKNVGKSIEL